MKLKDYPFPDFPPLRYGAAIRALTRMERIPVLGPGVPDRNREAELYRFNPLTDLGAPVTNPVMAQCCYSGLWILHSFWEQSHAICQEIPTPEGSFWHAILHRREPDPMNSKYWYRQVGQHLVFDQLVQLASKIGYAYITPIRFVDFCERHRGKDDTKEELARWVQLLEWQLLFRHCWEEATGSSHSDQRPTEWPDHSTTSGISNREQQ